MTRRFQSAANSVAVLVVLAIALVVTLSAARAVQKYGLAGIGILGGLLVAAVVLALVGTALLRSAFAVVAHLLGYARAALLSVERRLRSR